jgi:serine protease Do
MVRKFTIASLMLSLAALSASPAFAATEQHWVERPTSAPRVQLPSIAPLVKEADPAVLSIYVESRGGPEIDPHDPRLEWFRRHGLQFEAPDLKQQGQGTGFIIHPDGYALTNHHVVENATKIQVRLDGRRDVFNATVIGDDPRTDVALIKLEGNRHDWPAIPLGDSDALQVGDYVVAIGNPFGLDQSVSMGIVSAKGRRDIAPSGRRGLYDFIQTDASINPGNSGGPLLNLAGEAIGINAAINAAGQGIGFAIPMNLVKKLIPDLKKNGKVDRAWIGVSITEVRPDVAKGLGLEGARGALVTQIVDGSPGYKAGLKPGDVITKFDGRPIEASSDLPLLASTAGVGRNVNLELVRDGELRSAKVTLGAMPKDNDDDSVTPTPSNSSTEPGKLGIRIDTLDDDLRRRIDAPAKLKGAVIVQVDPRGAAAEAGLEGGDVITELNGKTVTDAQSFVKVLDAAKSGALLKMLVHRKGSTTFIALVKP